MKQILYFTFMIVLALGAVASCESPQPQPVATIQQHFDTDQVPVLSAQLPAESATGQGDTIIITETPTGAGIIAWLQWVYDNYQAFAGMIVLLIMFYEPIARLTPTEKDNNLLRTIQSWLDALLPNRKKGGGTFNAYRTRNDAPRAGFVPEQKE